MQPGALGKLPGMILSSAAAPATPVAATVLAAFAAVLYLLAALPARALQRFAPAALVGGWLLHGALLLVDIAGIGLHAPGARLGFAPVLSLTIWLVLAVYTVESRLVPLPGVRFGLALSGLLAVGVGWAFPGEFRPIASPLAPLHFTLGVGAYALFGAAVLHAFMLDGAERRLRGGEAVRSRAAGPAEGGRRHALGMPLLQLERLTFRFVQAGFVVLSATLVLGAATQVQWSWDHKTVFSLLAWAVFAALLVGRWQRGWRGRRATRWLYAGSVLLLLAYVGSRFVVEVLLPRLA